MNVFEKWITFWIFGNVFHHCESAKQKPKSKKLLKCKTMFILKINKRIKQNKSDYVSFPVTKSIFRQIWLVDWLSSMLLDQFEFESKYYFFFWVQYEESIILVKISHTRFLMVLWIISRPESIVMFFFFSLEWYLSVSVRVRVQQSFVHL